MKQKKSILEKFIEDFESNTEINLNQFRQTIPFVRFTKKDVMDIVDELEKNGLITTNKKRGSYTRIKIKSGRL